MFGYSRYAARRIDESTFHERRDYLNPFINSEAVHIFNLLIYYHERIYYKVYS